MSTGNVFQERGVRTVAVGIGYGINHQELLQIAMNDNHYVVQVDNFDALKDKLQMILDESCQGKILYLQNTGTNY